MVELRNKKDFLTTLPEWDLGNLVEQTAGESCIFCLILIEPRATRTGLLEQRGNWIQHLWRNVLAQMPAISGHRLAWSELLFIVPGTDLCGTLQRFKAILQSLIVPELESRAVFSVVEGDYRTSLMIIDQMGMELSKWYQIGRCPRFEHKLLDGMEQQTMKKLS